MSDNIPFEIQTDIIKRLPVKSLLQFRSVSKTWKSLIDSSYFIPHCSGQQHLLVCYDGPLYLEQKYVSIVDDNTLPQHRVSPTLPLLVKMLNCSKIIGASHGLLCFYSRPKNMAVVWNISIRKAVGVVLPSVKAVNAVKMMKCETVLGFGVCRETIDPKIVKIVQVNSLVNMERRRSIPSQVEVFTLSTGAWRSPYGNDLPRKTIRFGYFKVTKDGLLYWLATDKVAMDDGLFGLCNLIISFDMTSEEFGEINLPSSLANQPYYNLSMFKLRESLVVLEHGLEANEPVFDVWMMDDGVPKSFTKVFTINVDTPDAMVYGFKNSGEPIIEIEEVVGKSGMQLLFSVYPYTESMLLLDQPSNIIYDNGSRYIKVKSRARRNRGF